MCFTGKATAPKKRKRVDAPETPVITPKRKDFDTPVMTPDGDTPSTVDDEWTSAMKKAREAVKRNVKEQYDDKPGEALTAKVCKYTINLTCMNLQCGCVNRQRLSVLIPISKRERNQFMIKATLCGYTANGRKKDGLKPQ